MLLPLLLLAPIWYFLLIRPQTKQANDQRALISALKKGDEVVTQSGLLGKIYAVSDRLVTLEIANGVRVRILKTSIQGKGTVTDEPVVPAKAEEKEEK